MYALKTNTIVPNLAYKVITKANWNNFIKMGITKCYGFDNDIQSGFIHLSTINQLERTLDKLVPEDNQGSKMYKMFNILCIDLDKSKGVKWECKHKCTHKCRSTTESVTTRTPLYSKTNNFCEKWPHIYGYISHEENIVFAMDLALYKKEDINQDL